MRKNSIGRLNLINCFFVSIIMLFVLIFGAFIKIASIVGRMFIDRPTSLSEFKQMIKDIDSDFSKMFCSDDNYI